MSLRRVVLAFLLASGLAAAADGHPKPPKVHKHAVSTPKAQKHSKEATRGVRHKTPKVAKHKVSTPKMAKHKTTKFKRRKA
jgi:hypothetical protein